MQKVTASVKAAVTVVDTSVGGTVEIIDQNDDVIVEVEAGGQYQVLVVSEIVDTTPIAIPTDSIIDNPFV